MLPRNISDAAGQHEIDDLLGCYQPCRALQHAIGRDERAHPHAEYQRDQRDQRLKGADQLGPGGPPDHHPEAEKTDAVIGETRLRIKLQEREADVEADRKVEDQKDRGGGVIEQQHVACSGSLAVFDKPSS